MSLLNIDSVHSLDDCRFKFFEHGTLIWQTSLPNGEGFVFEHGTFVLGCCTLVHCSCFSIIPALGFLYMCVCINFCQFSNRKGSSSVCHHISFSFLQNIVDTERNIIENKLSILCPLVCEYFTHCTFFSVSAQMRVISDLVTLKKDDHDYRNLMDAFRKPLSQSQASMYVLQFETAIDIAASLALHVHELIAPNITSLEPVAQTHHMALERIRVQQTIRMHW